MSASAESRGLDSPCLRHHRPRVQRVDWDPIYPGERTVTRTTYPGASAVNGPRSPVDQPPAPDHDQTPSHGTPALVLQPSQAVLIGDAHARMTKARDRLVSASHRMPAGRETAEDVALALADMRVALMSLETVMHIGLIK